METSHPKPAPGEPAWRAIAHRWFVQYNPTYLLSAAFVLGGVTMVSLALPGIEASIVAETYALALIAGAAILRRVGQRRPAVLLALLAVLYQVDLTLLTETSACLGAFGVGASIAWVALFVGKIYALAAALRVRISRRAIGTATLGAAAIAIGPWALPFLRAGGAGVLLAGLVFLLGAVAPRTIDATGTLPGEGTPWQRTVLRRSIGATWMLWIAAVVVHVLFWSADRSINLALPVLALGFFAAARAARERWLWTLALGAPIAAAIFAPPYLWVGAAFAAVAFIVRAFSDRRSSAPVARVDADADRSPYRADRTRSAPPPSVTVSFERVDAVTRARLLSSALFATYAALFAFGYAGGPLPPHEIALDLALGVAAIVIAASHRSRVPLVVPALVWTHAAAVSGLVPRPRSMLDWGIAFVGVGFVMLFASIATTVRLRERSADDAA